MLRYMLDTNILNYTVKNTPEAVRQQCEAHAGEICTSSVTGHLMKQDDDILRAYTVGKAVQDVVFDESGKASGVYGYLYCG